MGAGLSMPARLEYAAHFLAGKPEDLTAKSTLFRSWADSKSAVEGSPAARHVSLTIQLAFALLGNSLAAKDGNLFNAARLYADMAEADTARLEGGDVKSSFEAALRYLKVRFEIVEKRVAEEREADMLVAYAKIKVREEVEDKKALEARIADLHVRLDALKKRSASSAKAGGAYRFPRRMSRAYCRRTPCRRMGFTQRASCRPYKNCYRGRGATRKNRQAA